LLFIDDISIQSGDKEAERMIEYHKLEKTEEKVTLARYMPGVAEKDDEKLEKFNVETQKSRLLYL
jgi:hypothetical protein